MTMNSRNILVVSLIALVTASCVSGGNRNIWRPKRLQMDWGVMPVKVFVSDPGHDQSVVDEALEFWNLNVGCQVFEQTEVPSTNPFVVIREDWSNSDSVSHSRIGSRRGYNVVFEISLNDRYDFVTQSSALEHELGHALGLADSNMEGHVMFNKRSPMFVPDERAERKIRMYGSALDPDTAKLLNNRYCHGRK